MIRLLGSKTFFVVFLPLYAALIFSYPYFLSISSFEASIFYGDSGYLGIVTRFFCNIFGQNDFALRIFFIAVYFASLPLFYSVSKRVLKQESDARLSLVIFCLLPGSSLSALLVMKSAVIIFLSLTFIYLYGKGRFLSAFAVLGLSAVLDGAFAILFLSLIFYAIHKKDNALIFVSLLLFGLSMAMFGFDDGGRPRGYFLDTLGVYMSIFSPILFLYFVFAIYKIKPEDRPIGWYVSFWALIFSLLLSFRQKIMIYDFAPFVVLAIPFMVKTFFSSYRIRIGKNKRIYEIGFGVVLLSLVAVFTLSFFNHPLYACMDNKKAHFAYNYQVAKELARELKNMGVNECVVADSDMAIRLKFYGIKEGGHYLVGEKQLKNSKKVSIIYSGVEVTSYYVTKINTL